MLEIQVSCDRISSLFVCLEKKDYGSFALQAQSDHLSFCGRAHHKGTYQKRLHPVH